MAHLAGSGPPGAKCKACQFFEPKTTAGALTGSCKAYRVLRPKPKRKPYFDQSTEACRHFVAG